MQATSDEAASPQNAPLCSPQSVSPLQHTPAPVKEKKPKRKKFSVAEDVILLRQAIADTPFSAARGTLMEAWEAVAANVREVEGFSKTHLKGKAAQAHFTGLIQAHRDWDNKSISLSGASESYKERKQLLDEAVLLVDEKAREDATKAKNKKAKALEDETIAKSVREEAVARMRKRSDPADGGSATKKKLKFTVYDFIREDNELEREKKAAERKEDLEERRREREQTREERRQEREEEREERRQEREEEREERAAARAHQLELARLENEKYSMLLKLATLDQRSNERGK